MRPAIILTALLALSACGNDKTTTVTTSDGKEVKVTADGDNTSDSGTITFEGQDGEGTGKISFGDAATKAGLPLGLPVYPGGEIKGAFTGQGGAGEGVGGMATVLTNADAATVIAFYKAEATKRGYEIKSQTTSTTDKGSTASFTAKGKNDASLIVTVSPESSGKSAVVIIGGQKR
jgi:hypothetical protein